MENDLERHERILAPLQLVWEEVGSLEQILAKTPQASGYDLAPEGTHANGKAKVVWGPIRWILDVQVGVTELIPRERVCYRVTAPAHGLALDATVDLVVVGESETRLDYRGHLEVRHRLANRLQGMFNEVVEDHVHGLISRVKIKAEQRRLAQERLLS